MVPYRTGHALPSTAMMTTRSETITVPDGSFVAHLSVPDAGRGSGIVLIQEIFGVNDYLTGVAGRLADQGYVVACPDLYWRIEPNLALDHDEDGLAQAMKLVELLDIDSAVADCVATAVQLKSISEVNDGVAFVGFSLGGSLAYLATEAWQPRCVVSYYGPLVPDRVDVLDRVSCPVLFHFGGSDPFIPREDVAVVETAVRHIHDIELHVQEHAGHAFDNDKAPAFHDAEAAAEAWRITSAFLERHLPTG
jgi:carboxymethylenebutenolidase